MGIGQTIGSDIGDILPIPGGSTILSTIGGLFDSIFGGGRSAEQIKADEQNSAYSNQQGILINYGVNLTLGQVAQILRPGWDAGENGTQLYQRISSFVEKNISVLKNQKNGGGGGGGDAFGGSLFSNNFLVIGGVALVIVLLLIKK